MRGNFICFHPGGKVSIHLSNKMSWMQSEPRIEDISQSYRPIQEAERVLFIGDDGSVYLMKDRYTKQGQLLRKIGEQPPFEATVTVDG
jgi:hypothetical protein